MEHRQKDADFGPVAPVEFFARDPLEVAPELLNCIVVSRLENETVALRLTEVEAYRGTGIDPGSHAYRGRTERNQSMFMAGGHLYVYRSYGIHWCGNVVCGAAGVASGILMRAGEVIHGADIAHARRTAAGTVRSAVDLARGPGRLGAALGLTKALDGIALTGGAALTLHLGSSSLGRANEHVAISTRTGVSGPGALLDYRFYLQNEPTVSPHKPVAYAP